MQAPPPPLLPLLRSRLQAELLTFSAADAWARVVADRVVIVHGKPREKAQVTAETDAKGQLSIFGVSSVGALVMDRFLVDCVPSGLVVVDCVAGAVMLFPSLFLFSKASLILLRSTRAAIGSCMLAR